MTDAANPSSTGITRDPTTFINARLTDLAEANALYGKDQRLGAPDKVARNDREISWLKDLRTIIAYHDVAQAEPVAIDRERFCIAFTWAYGTAIELKHYGRVPDDGHTPETLWAKSDEEDREFMRGVVRDTFSALGTGDPAYTAREPSFTLAQVKEAFEEGYAAMWGPQKPEEVDPFVADMHRAWEEHASSLPSTSRAAPRPDHCATADSVCHYPACTCVMTSTDSETEKVKP